VPSPLLSGLPISKPAPAPILTTRLALVSLTSFRPPNRCWV